LFLPGKFLDPASPNCSPPTLDSVVIDWNGMCRWSRSQPHKHASTQSSSGPCAILQDLHAKSVDLYLHPQGLDTTTPSGRAMFQMLGVFAEFERAMIRERVMAGLARARAEGTRLGRPATVADDAAKVQTIRAARAAGKSIRTSAREQGVGIGTVSRLTG
jgi:DNA invertase Pin-like site-specific DNA recombinase